MATVPHMARQAPTVARPLHALEPAADAGPDLHVVSPEAGPDLSRAERAVADLLAALGLDPSSDHLRETPRRRETASSDSPSWRAWSSCSLAACRSRSGRPPRSPTGS